MRVRQFYNKNQFIITGKEGTVFQSYNSIIAILKDDNSLTLGIDWDYSHTTLKHLYLFLDEYCYCVEGINTLREHSNKKAYIQKLIDKGIIKYNEELS